jgi:hypothetical protein
VITKFGTFFDLHTSNWSSHNVSMFTLKVVDLFQHFILLQHLVATKLNTFKFMRTKVSMHSNLHACIKFPCTQICMHVSWYPLPIVFFQPFVHLQQLLITKLSNNVKTNIPFTINLLMLQVNVTECSLMFPTTSAPYIICIVC